MHYLRALVSSVQLQSYTYAYKLPRMKPSEWIEALIADGLTEAAIAAEVNVSQPTINRLRRGKTADPRSSLVEALKKLHASRFAHGCSPSDAGDSLLREPA